MLDDFQFACLAFITAGVVIAFVVLSVTDSGPELFKDVVTASVTGLFALAVGAKKKE